MNIVSSEIVSETKPGSIQLAMILLDRLYSNVTQSDKDEQQKNFDKLLQIREKAESDLQKNIPNLYISSQGIILFIMEKFFLNPSHFDSRGDKIFSTSSSQLFIRGKKNYHQPKQGWVRYGLRVYGVYENDEWMKKDGNSEEWAIGFHGTNQSPEEIITTIIKTNVILAGPNNGCGGSVSKEGRTIPTGAYKGIYFTYDVENCYKKKIVINGQNYEIAFQCRIQPDHHYDYNGQVIVSDGPRWVRPYGILLKQI